MAETLLQKAERLGIKPINSPVVSNSNSLLEKAKSLGMKPANPISQDTQITTRDVKGSAVGDFLTGNTQKFGKTIGEAVVAPENADKYATSLEQHTKIQNDLLKTIKAKKALGQDTSRLESALDTHTTETPKLKDFTGDVIDKTAKQVYGEAIGTGLEALSGGILETGKTLATKGLTTGEKVLQGAKVGTGYGAIGGITQPLQENKTGSEVLEGGLKGAVIGGSLGGGLGLLGGKGEQILAKNPEKLVAEKTQKISDITGRVLQGEKSDLKIGQKILGEIDASKIKTYEDLASSLNKTIEKDALKVDTHLSKDTKARKLADLNLPIKIDDKIVKNHNFVTDAVTQIRDYYKKTNNLLGQVKINQLEKKIKTNGVSLKEVNDLARLHGRELNAYNANGELASGLTKQAAENTRQGLKNTTRELSGNKKVLEDIDKKISETIRVRDLAQQMSENVNKLKQKIQERSIGGKIGYGIGKVIDTLGFGSPKGIIEAMLPRGQGRKILNPLDLEKTLQKSLQDLQQLNKEPSENILQKLQKFFQENKSQSSNAKLSKQPRKNIPITIPKIIPKTLPKKPVKVNRK